MKLQRVNFFYKKKAKITKRSHPYKGYASKNNAETLNSFNSELQRKDTELAITNKQTDWLSEFRGFKFVTTFLLEFKKRESDDETKYSTFSSNSKAENLIKESDIDNVFEWIYSVIIKISKERFELDYFISHRS